jgi:hypothetical protein
MANFNQRRQSGAWWKNTTSQFAHGVQKVKRSGGGEAAA